MSVLYLGPYRQDDSDGIVSRLYLKDISLLHKTVSRPVYIRNRIVAYQGSFPTENNNHREFDTLVQHLPIDQLVINRNFKRNICIPITDSTVLTKNQINKLSFFDKILIDNISLYENVSDCKINKKKYELTSPDISSLEFNDNKYNLSLYDFSTKLYSILDFTVDIDLINDLCLSFISMNKQYKNISLLLFIQNIDQVSIQNLSLKIKELYKVANNKTKGINIIPISISTDLQPIVVCHNTGDIFLDISGNKSPLNHHIAKRLNKIILDTKNILSISNIKNSTYYTEGIYYINQDNLQKSISKILSEKKANNTYNNHKKIHAIL